VGREREPSRTRRERSEVTLISGRVRRFPLSHQMGEGRGEGGFGIGFNKAARSPAGDSADNAGTSVRGGPSGDLDGSYISRNGALAALNVHRRCTQVPLRQLISVPSFGLLVIIAVEPACPFGAGLEFSPGCPSASEP
jgi:hypothetical protein